MTQETESPAESPSDQSQIDSSCRFHLQVGWWSLLVFLSLGIVLEILHGLKIGWYLDAANETRRLLWRLAHAHGTLLALVHLGFAASVMHFPYWKNATRKIASRCMISAGVLMPVGFFLGGAGIYGGDPGLGVLLVIPGAAFLFLAVLLTACATTGSRADTTDTGESP